MLPQPGKKEVLVKQNYIFEPCFDGTRVLLYKNDDKIILLNRKSKNISYKYPEFNSAWTNINADSAVLDGVIVVLDKDKKPSLNLLQQREILDTSRDILAKSKEIPATLFVFDALELFEADFTSTTLDRRKEKLREIIRENENFRVMPYIGNGREVWTEMQKLGVEGVIAKDIRSEYQDGKSWAWMKIENIKKANCFIVGYAGDKTFADSPVLTLILGFFSDKQVKYAGRTEIDLGFGKGFDDFLSKKLIARIKKEKLNRKETPFLPEEDIEKLKKIYAGKQIMWLMPSIVAQVKHFGFTENSELIKPVFMRLRDDKWGEDCVLEKKDFQ